MSRMSSMLQSLKLPTPQELAEDITDWIKTRGPWWATSVVAHAVVLSAAMLLMGTVIQHVVESDAPAFESAEIDTEVKHEELKDFEVGETPYEPTELTTDTLTQMEDTHAAVDEQINTTPDDPFSEAGGGGRADVTQDFGGLSGFEVKAVGPGPKVSGEGGLAGKGFGNSAGSGGAGVGFGGRGTGVRKAMLGRYGGTKGSERAVAAALFWLSKHQNPDGSWSLENYPKLCKDQSCVGKGEVNSDAGATALGLLPFLAAGQTHRTKGPYQQHIQRGLYWLVGHQDKGTGSLAAGSPHVMYTHGLAAICLCEAYGLSQDSQLQGPAQAALAFIERAQSPKDGGWRYNPGDDGDTSVVGWQVMALKSGKMAGLQVADPTFANSQKFLKAVSSGYGGIYSYMPGTGPTGEMTSVGLLCAQYLGAPQADPGIQEGMNYLMKNLPDAGSKRIYYWYYATQVMHNLPGEQWDIWNRKMRKILIDSQSKQGCAAGSWDPAGHPFGKEGGRIFVTSLSCLTLEVYYRYLPLYQLDGGGKKGAAKEAAKEPAKAAPMPAEKEPEKDAK